MGGITEPNTLEIYVESPPPPVKKKTVKFFACVVFFMSMGAGDLYFFVVIIGGQANTEDISRYAKRQHWYDLKTAWIKTVTYCLSYVQVV